LLGDGGEQAVAVVQHDGGGGDRFGRGSDGAVVGSEEGGALAISGADGGQCARVLARRRRRPFGAGRKMIGL
jgi:hypothetical protein